MKTVTFLLFNDVLSKSVLLTSVQGSLSCAFYADMMFFPLPSASGAGIWMKC